MHRTNRNTTVIVSQPQYKDGEVQRAFIMTERRPPSHACQIARSGAPAPPGAGAAMHRCLDFGRLDGRHQLLVEEALGDHGVVGRAQRRRKELGRLRSEHHILVQEVREAVEVDAGVVNRGDVRDVAKVDDGVDRISEVRSEKSLRLM